MCYPLLPCISELLLLLLLLAVERTRQSLLEALAADHVKRTDKINGRNVRARRNHTAGGCVFTVVRSLHMIPGGYIAGMARA